LATNPFQVMIDWGRSFSLLLAEGSIRVVSDDGYYPYAQNDYYDDSGCYDVRRRVMTRHEVGSGATAR